MAKAAYLTVLPLVVVLALVEFYPILFSFYLSITSEVGGFAGGASYAQLLSDPAFFSAVGVSLLYSIGSTLVAFAIGMLLTFLLTQKFRGREVVLAISLAPLATAPIIAGILWSPSAVWDDINTFLHFVLRLPYIDLTATLAFFPVMVLSDAWEWTPIIVLVSLSIISSTPKEVFEAAALSGASGWRLFRQINIPAIVSSPVIQFVVILRFTDAIRSFEIPYAWSNWVGFPQSVGSPVDSLTLYLYKLMFVPVFNFPVQYISALAISLLGVTLVTASALLKLLESVWRPTQ